MTPGDSKPVIVGVSGASGSVMAKATVDALLVRNVPTILVCSNDARLVWHEEMDAPFNEELTRWREHPHFRHYAISDMRAPIASGTFPTRGMVVVPCSMNSVASIAHGLSSNLLLRSADVCLKERRQLVVVPRETPLHSTHLENMLTLSRMGAVVLPPDPAFYLRPQSIEDVVQFVVGRILVALGVEDALEQGLQYRPDEA